MVRMPRRACAAVICALVLGTAAKRDVTAEPAGKAAPKPVAPDEKPARATFSLDPAGARARSNGRLLVLNISWPEIQVAGRLTARVLDLGGKTLGTAAEEVAASKSPVKVRLRLPLTTSPGVEADLLRIAWRFQPSAGVASEGILGLSEILDMPFLSVRGQETLVAGSRAALRISVRDQRGRPLPDVSVTLLLQAGGGSRTGAEPGSRALMARGTSARGGDLHLALDLPDGWAGTRAQLSVEAASGPFRRAYRHRVGIRREAQVLLTTDKPIYQPGQTLHLRILALRQPSRYPLTGRPVLFSLRDPRGTLLAEQRARTDDFGVAHTELPISEGVRPGDFKVAAEVESDSRNRVEATRSVKVSRYEVPDFRVSIAPTRGWAQPGSPLGVTITANALSGQPLRQAPVTVTSTAIAHRSLGRGTRRCMGELERLTGHTGAEGSWSFQVPLQRIRSLCGTQPTGLLLTAEVVAPGGARQRATLRLPVSNGPLQIGATPEAGLLIRSVPQRIYLQAARPDGEPVRATFTVRLPASALVAAAIPAGGTRAAARPRTGEVRPRANTAARPQGAEALRRLLGPPRPSREDTTTIRLRTDAEGLAALVVKPEQQTLYLTVVARDDQGHQATRSLGMRTQAPRVLVRPEPGVITAGAPLRIALTAPAGSGGGVQVDVKQSEQIVHTASGHLSGTHGQVELRIPERVDGLLGLAVRIGLNPEHTGWAPVLVRPSRWLDVDVTTDRKVYAPGETARLTLRIADEAGRGRASAVDLRLVDEGVFVLAGKKPESEEGELLLPAVARGSGYPVAGLTLARLVKDPRAKAPGRVAHLLLARLQEGAWTMAEDSLVHDGADDVPIYRRRLARRLRERLSSAYQARFQQYAAVQRRAWRALAQKRALCLGEHAAADEPAAMVADGLLPRAFLLDPWGQPLAWVVDASFAEGERYRVTVHSLGPDGVEGSDDDLLLGPWWLRVPPLRRNQRCGVGYGGGGHAMGSYFGRGPTVFMGRASVSGAMDTGAMERMLSDSPEARTRRDFRETLAVFPGLRTGADGLATVTVPLADNLTTWTITALASDREGRLGGQVSRLRTFQPFSVDVRIPPLVTRGDQITARVVVKNELPAAQWVRVSLRPAPWYRAVPTPDTRVHLRPGHTGPRLVVRPTVEQILTRVSLVAPKSAVEYPFLVQVTRLGRHELHVTAQAPSRSDAVARPVMVEPEGVEQRLGASGMLASAQIHELRLPDALVPDTTGVEATLEPDVLSSTWGSFEGLIRRPYGCFEQTSSTTYPNILVMRHLRSGPKERSVREKARSYLAQGYQRLTSFEVEHSGGFSLFGHAPAQPMLTAFGLGEFHDLSRVMPVDRALIGRIQRYLAKRQRADGTFRPEGSLIESGATSPRSALTATAYVALQLARSGYRGKALRRAIQVLRQREKEVRGDAYTLALAIRALGAGGSAADVAHARRWAAALALLAVKTPRQAHWRPGGKATLYGHGESASVEATGLAVLALLQTGSHPELVPPAVRWILSRRSPDGAWSTTQATVLALEALLGARSLVVTRAPTLVKVFLDDELVGILKPVPGARSVPVRLSVSRPIQPGIHRLALRPEGSGRALYQVSLRYNTFDAPAPKAASASSVGFAVRWSHARARPGDTVSARVQVDNGLGRSLDAPMAEIGLPPGLRLGEGSLRTELGRGVLSQWERRGSRLLLYFTRLPVGRSTIPLTLYAEAPLAARIPPSRFYEYYRPEESWYAPAGRIEVSAPAATTASLSSPF